MPESQPDTRVVFTAESSQDAAAVARLLSVNDIAAEVAGGTKTTSDALTGATEVVEPDAYRVVVTDPAKLKAAQELLASKEAAEAMQAARDRRANRTGTGSATCEDCGKDSTWPAQALGTTEVCPHCGSYMDIPDPDDDWSGVDFGEAEGENEGEE